MALSGEFLYSALNLSRSHLGVPTMRMSVSVSDPRYTIRLQKVSMFQIALDKVGDWLAAVGGSAVFLEILRRFFQRRAERRKNEMELNVRVFDEAAELRKEAYQREKEAQELLSAERERRHKAELEAMEYRLKTEIAHLGATNEALIRRLHRAHALLDAHQIAHPDSGVPIPTPAPAIITAT